jgi:ribokinase
MKTACCVVGSLNMDMVTRVSRFPSPGETIRGISFRIFPGGKGANQAVALARLGARVEMIGALGDDMLGKGYREILTKEGISVEGVRVVTDTATGTASIEVSEAGENHIVIVGGANDSIDPAYVQTMEKTIRKSSILLLQLEIPLDSIMETARTAVSAGVPVMLDPAPARELPHELLSMLTYITPNETEAEILTGADTSTEEGVRKAATRLLAEGIGTVIVKAGSRGAYIADGTRFTHVPAHRVKVVDSVAAGDSFNAGLAFALCEGMDIYPAVRFANAVGALATTREGAQSAMPSRREVEALLATSAPSAIK